VGIPLGVAVFVVARVAVVKVLAGIEARGAAVIAIRVRVLVAAVMLPAGERTEHLLSLMRQAGATTELQLLLMRWAVATVGQVLEQQLQMLWLPLLL